MGFLSSTEFNTLEDLLKHQLEDLFDAENRLVKALPKMSEAAHSSSLKQAFDSHLSETKNHVTRLEQVFSLLGWKPERETCEAMKGLIKEGEEMIDAKGDHTACDAALIAAAQRVEHYEIAGYGTVRSLARQLGHERVAEILQDTLDEEGQADHHLTAIAEGSANTVA